MTALDRHVGLGRLRLMHVNDSKHALGSRKDRHEHIGQGQIGLEGFRLVMTDCRLALVPKVLETHKSLDLHEDAANLAVLRGLEFEQRPCMGSQTQENEASGNGFFKAHWLVVSERKCRPPGPCCMTAGCESSNAGSTSDG